jgi:steroid 5-alpha reductase family enzyme
MLGQLMLASACIALGLILWTWVISLRLDDASIIDVAWGIGFVLIAAICLAGGHGALGRRIALAGMAAAWGVRLAVHIGRRNHGQPEDFRYAAIRERDFDHFWIVSLYRVYLVQAVLMFVIALPLVAGSGRGAAHGLGPLDGLGVAVWAVGLGFEAVGDLQLARFKAVATNSWRVMDRGLWRYTRHPNYFGDVVAWWGIGIVAAGAGGTWWALVGPAVNTLILTRLTGKPLLESTIGERRPGYAAYVQRTSGFVPLPPRRPREPSET